jgi:iron complex outermembrane receptor protein
MKRIIKLSLIAFIVSQYCHSVSAAVVSPKANVVDNVERITITSNRKETLDTDLIMSVHGVGKKELAIDNGQHVAESLNSISGVLIDQLSGGQGHKAAIRMPMNTSGYYLYLQDNIPLQSPAFFNHNALWWSNFNSNVARMQVLRFLVRAQLQQPLIFYLKMLQTSLKRILTSC